VIVMMAIALEDPDVRSPFAYFGKLATLASAPPIYASTSAGFSRPKRHGQAGQSVNLQASNLSIGDSGVI
jgi:hypothetical protein